MKRTLLFFAPVILLLIAYGLRISQLDAQDIWGDEAWSIAVSGWRWGDIAFADTNPPFYHYLLFITRRLWGTSPFAFRYLSLLCGMVVVALMGRLGRDLSPKRTPLPALFVTAVAAFLIYYAQETRMYGPTLVGATGSLVAFHQLTRRQSPPKIRWLSYIAATLIGLFSHYYMLAPLFGQAIWLAGMALADKRRYRPLFLRFCAIWLLMASLLLPFFLIHRTHWAGQSAFRPQVWTLSSLWQITKTTLGAFGVGITVSDAHKWWAIMPVVAAALGFHALWRTRRASALMLATSLISGLIFAWLATALLPFFYPRYLLVSMPPFLMLIAAGFSTRSRFGIMAATLLAPLFLVVNLGSTNSYHNDPAFVKGGYGQMSAYMADRLQLGDLILLNNPLQASLYDYYKPSGVPFELIPRAKMLNDMDAAAYLETASADFRRVWLVESGDPASFDPHHRAQNGLGEMGAFAIYESFPGVSLRLYVLAQPDTPSQTVDAILGEQIALTGFALEPTGASAGDTLLITLFWEALRPIDADYTVFIHLLDENGALVAQVDGQPGGGGNPTSGWAIGEPVRAGYALALPDELPAGRYTLSVGLYEWPSLERLSIFELGRAAGDSLPLTMLTVP